MCLTQFCLNLRVALLELSSTDAIRSPAEPSSAGPPSESRWWLSAVCTRSTAQRGTAWHGTAQAPRQRAGSSGPGSCCGADSRAAAGLTLPLPVGFCLCLPLLLPGQRSGQPSRTAPAEGARGRLWRGEGTCRRVRVERSHGTILMPVCALGRVSVLVSNTLSCSWRRACSPPFSELPSAAWSSDPHRCRATL